VIGKLKKNFFKLFLRRWFNSYQLIDKLYWKFNLSVKVDGCGWTLPLLRCSSIFIRNFNLTTIVLTSIIFWIEIIRGQIGVVVDPWWKGKVILILFFGHVWKGRWPTIDHPNVTPWGQVAICEPICFLHKLQVPGLGSLSAQFVLCSKG